MNIAGIQTVRSMLMSPLNDADRVIIAVPLSYCPHHGLAAIVAVLDASVARMMPRSPPT
jgi:hypothetical protein